MPDHSDDLYPGQTGQRDADVFAQRALAGPDCPRDALIDDANRFDVFRIAFGKETPLNERNADGAKVVRRDNPPIGAGRFVLFALASLLYP
jgi:hypothetical protein